jgi:hypothetical protein
LLAGGALSIDDSPFSLMRLLINLDLLLASPRRLAKEMSAALPEKSNRDAEQRVIGQYLATHYVQPRRFVCLRRTGTKPGRYHFRPAESLKESAAGPRTWVGLICEYDESIRVLRAVKWETVRVMPLSPQERIFAGEAALVGFNFGVTYSDSAAVSFLRALPEEAADLSTPLALWHDYLDWRKKLAKDKAALRYAYTEKEVLPSRTAVRFFLKNEEVAETLRQRFANEDVKVLGTEPSLRAPQGFFRNVRAETRRPWVGGGAVETPGRGVASALSVVLDFDGFAVEELRLPDEGFLQLAMEGEIAALDVQIQGLARLGEGRALNPRLRTWLFDVAQALPIPPESKDWQPERKLNPEQRTCVGRALVCEDLLLLWGPPGTGKTTVIAELCSQMARRKQRVLISSQANLAVTQALERLPKLSHVRPIFISSAKKREGVLAGPRGFMQGWLGAVAQSARAAGETESEATWRTFLGDWAARLEAVGEDDFTPTFEQVYLKNANVVGATCNETGKTDFLNARTLNPAFDFVIVDEVSKATPPEMLLPMLQGKRVMLVGDHRQLPPMFRDVTFEEARENADVTPEAVEQFRELVTASLFEGYFRAAPPSVRYALQRQYRMHPQIMTVVNHFYADSPLLAGDGNVEFVREKQHGLQLRSLRGRPWLETGHPFVWIDTSRDALGRPVQEEAHGTSRKNAVEADVCAEIVAGLFRQNQGPALDVAVISFYKAQVSMLRERLSRERLDHHYDFDVMRDINTVDQFQGSERDVIIVSLVRTGPRLTGEFVRDFRRINVAFSRARKLLIVLASRETFAVAPVTAPTAAGASEEQRVYAAIHELARETGAAFSVSDVLAPKAAGPAGRT